MAPITPFSHGQAAVIGFIVCLMGFFGGLVMSAIKRDYGVKDWGNMIRQYYSELAGFNSDQYFDGFSIGSNDMTQLTLGLDRDSGLVSQ